jgi:hypothetical protein
LFLIHLFIVYSLFGADVPYDFENQEYYFKAYYSDIGSPPFRFSFYNDDFNLDVPILNRRKAEEGQYIKGTIQGKYVVSRENNFLYINIPGRKYLVLHTGSRVCVLIDCANNDVFFGLNKDSKKCRRKSPGRHLCRDNRDNLVWRLSRTFCQQLSYRNSAGKNS